MTLPPGFQLSLQDVCLNPIFEEVLPYSPATEDDIQSGDDEIPHIPLYSDRVLALRVHESMLLPVVTEDELWPPDGKLITIIDVLDRLDQIEAKIDHLCAALDRAMPVIDAYLDPAASGPGAWAVRRQLRKGAGRG